MCLLRVLLSISKLWRDFVLFETKCFWTVAQTTNSFAPYADADTVASQFAVTLKNKRRKWHEKSNVVNKFFIIYYFVDLLLLLLLFAMPTQSFQTWDSFNKKNCEQEFMHVARFIYSKFFLFLWNFPFLSDFSVLNLFFFCCYRCSLNNHNNRQYPRYVHNFRSI